MQAYAVHLVVEGHGNLVRAETQGERTLFREQVARVTAQGRVRLTIDPYGERELTIVLVVVVWYHCHVLVLFEPKSYRWRD